MAEKVAKDVTETAEKVSEKIEVKQAEKKEAAKPAEKEAAKPAEKKVEISKPAEKQEDKSAEKKETSTDKVDTKPAEKKAEPAKAAKQLQGLKEVCNAKIFMAPSEDAFSIIFSGIVDYTGGQVNGMNTVMYVKPGFGAVIGYIK